MTPLRIRFEAHAGAGWTPTQRRLFLAPHPTDPAQYAAPEVQARWTAWQAAQPGPLNLGTARAYLETLKARAVFSRERTAILKAAQHLIRCIRNDNPELF